MKFSTKQLVRLLWFIIIVLSLSAGYYQAAFENEQKKTKQLEQNYARTN